VERGGQVRIDDRVPVLIGHFLQGHAHLAAYAARVVDQDVDGIQFREQRAHRRVVGQVHGVLVNAMYGGAARGKGVGDPGADTVRGSGDDGGSTGQPFGHRLLSFSAGTR
jgi:hypothetical protein